MARGKAPKGVGLKVSSGETWVNLPKVPLETVELDLTDGQDWAMPMGLSNRIVKIRVQYDRGDEERASGIAEKVYSEAKKVAAHVSRPEMVPVGERKVRIEGMTAQLLPMQAARMWMKARNPRHLSKLVRESVLGHVSVALEEAGPRTGPVRATDATFQGIGVENFMPFRGRQAVDGIGEGVFGVFGRYAAEEDRSNRSGKSAFVEAVKLVAYGQGRKVRTQDRYIHHGEEVARVGVSLGTGVDTVDLFREIERGKGSFVSIDDKRWKEKEGTAEIRRLIGLSIEDFMRGPFVQQGDLHGLLEQSSSEIVEDLVRWMDLTCWDRASKWISQRAGEQANQVSKLQGVIQYQEEQIRSLPDAEVIKASLLDVDRRATQLEEERQSLGSDNSAGEIRGLEARWEKARICVDAIRFLEQNGAGGPGDRFKLESTLSRWSEEFADASERLMQAMSRVGIAQEKTRAAKKRADSGFGGKCPVDGGKCPRTKEINKDQKGASDEHLLAQEAEEQVRKEMALWKAKKADLDSKIDKAKQVVAQVKAAQATIKEYAAAGYSPEDPDDLADRLSVLRKPSEAAARLGKVVSELQKQKDTRARLAAEAQLLAKAMVQKQVAGKELETAQTLLSELRYAALMCSRRGVQAAQIEEAALGIEASANTVVGMMGLPFRLKFCFETELQRMETACHECGNPYPVGEAKGKCPVCGEERARAKSDELTIQVEENGHSQDFGQDSGGGKGLLALAVRVALTRFLGARFMFLDEICSALDVRNLQALVSMLGRLKEMGIVQVFVISHRPEVADALPRNIVVTRHEAEGRSELAWESGK